jgi:hypothetical protein
MSKMLGNLTGEGWEQSDSAEQSVPSEGVRELLTPPAPRRRGQGLLWALTLASFLGGTYYGFQFRKYTAPAEPRLSIIDDGAALVAHWDPRALAETGQNTALRVTSAGRQRVIPLDSVALQRGALVLDVPAGQSFEPGLASADPEALRQQIRDQTDLNAQMILRLQELNEAAPKNGVK